MPMRPYEGEKDTGDNPGSTTQHIEIDQILIGVFEKGGARFWDVFHVLSIFIVYN